CDSFRGRNKYAKLLDGACEEEEDRPPPPPPPPPPQITLAQVARIEAAAAEIQSRVRGDAAIRQFADALAAEFARHADIGLGFVSFPDDLALTPLTPLASHADLESFAAEAASWAQRSQAIVA